MLRFLSCCYLLPATRHLSPVTRHLSLRLRFRFQLQALRNIWFHPPSRLRCVWGWKLHRWRGDALSYLRLPRVKPLRDRRVNRKQQLSSFTLPPLSVIWLGTFPRIEGNAKTKDHQSDRRGSHWSSWHAMNALPSHVRSYLAVRFPVSLLCVNRHRSVRLLCYLHRRGRKPQKKKKKKRSWYEEWMRAADCQHCFTRVSSSPRWRRSKSECGDLPPQTPLIGWEKDSKYPSLCLGCSSLARCVLKHLHATCDIHSLALIKLFSSQSKEEHQIMQQDQRSRN